MPLFSMGTVALLGKIGGAIAGVSAVDDMLGAPLKKAIYGDGGSGASVTGPQVRPIISENPAQGLYNYLRNLEDIAPGTVAENQPALTKSYSNMYENQLRKVKKLSKPVKKYNRQAKRQAEKEAITYSKQSM